MGSSRLSSVRAAVVIIVVGLAGLGTTMGAADRYALADRARLMQATARDAQAVSQGLSQTVRADGALLQTIAAGVARGGGELTSGELAQLSNPLAAADAVTGGRQVSLVVDVSAADSAQEQSRWAGLSDQPGLVWQLHSDAPEHFVVVISRAMTRPALPAGTDVSANPALVSAFLGSTVQAAVAVTDPYADATGTAVVTLVQPVRATPTGPPLGWLALDINVDALLSQTVSEHASQANLALAADPLGRHVVSVWRAGTAADVPTVRGVDHGVDIEGRSWHLRANASTVTAARYLSGRGSTTWMAGSMITTALLALLVTLFTSRGRAIRLAARATADLQIELGHRRDAEAHLLASEARFRATFDASPIGMAVVDINGRFVQVNEATCEAFGSRGELLVGRSLSELLDTSTQDGVAVVGVHRFVGERRVQGAGREMWVATSLTELPGIATDDSLFLAQIRDITTQRSATDELSRLAMLDPLTGLANRRALMALLEKAATPPVTSDGAALAFIDLDHFKQINDTHGHAVGDEILLAVASSLNSVIRGGDTAARLAGDEFVVFAEHCRDAQGLTRLLQRIRDAVNRPVRTSAGLLDVRASVGGSSFVPGQGPLDDPLNAADAAMYAAKQSRAAGSGVKR